jgi:hypothetical protein
MLSHGYIAGFQLVIKGAFFFLKKWHHNELELVWFDKSR